jgi:hypothetical protein
METPAPSVSAQRIVDVLRSRATLHSQVYLQDGRRLVVLNIAWGQDFGDSEYHITTNISPRVPEFSVDVFFTHQVARIVDPVANEVLYG